MEYCGPRGIPHSEFLNWSEADQDKAVAWVLAERTKCSQCGTVPSDWMDEKGRNRDPAPFIAKTQACVGCQTITYAREEIPDDQSQFVYVYLTPPEAENESDRQDRT